jgi:hypothetical protein
LIAAHERSCGGRFHRHWAGLGIIFVLMAMDEMFRIHEMTVRPHAERHAPQTRIHIVA